MLRVKRKSGKCLVEGQKKLFDVLITFLYYECDTFYKYSHNKQHPNEKTVSYYKIITEHLIYIKFFVKRTYDTKTSYLCKV